MNYYDKVSLIIVNWDGAMHLKKCFPTLEKIDYPNLEIIIVDNASQDKSIYIIKEFTKKMKERKVVVKTVINKKNLGFAGGNNAALPYVTGKYVLLLNNDTKVTKNFIKELVKVIEKNPTVDCVQSKILSMDYPDKLDSVGAYLTNTGFLYHYGYFQKNKLAYDATRDLYTAKGACMMIKKEVIERIGLFDQDFFAYFEESDFCHRIWLSGGKVMYAPKSVIYHKVGGTSNSMNNAFIQFHSFKNRINSYLKNLGTLELLKILPLHLLLCEIAAIGFIPKGRVDLFYTINRAIYWNIKTLKKTLKKRKKIQHDLRTVPDSKFMSTIKRNPGIRYYYYLFAKSLVGYRE
jgi:GT2 family glycosyltransferase